MRETYFGCPSRDHLLAGLGLLLLIVLAACGNPEPAQPAIEAPTPTGALTRSAATNTPEPRRPAATWTGQPTQRSASTSTSTVDIGERVATPTAAPAPLSSPTPLLTSGSPDLTGLRLTLQPVIDGLAMPLFVTHAGDGTGRLFIVEKTGVIRIWDGEQLRRQPFLDIRDRVGSARSEQGLLGLAFSPAYATDGHFYVNYTDRNGDTVIARFNRSPDPNIADPGSEFRVLAIAQPAANHNGGMLTFGPDGYLYIGTGDGGAANDRFGNGQNPDTFLGKMLRIDVTADPATPYLVPSDNPWVRADWNGQAVRGEIWAVGLRNPWRYSFDRLTGDLWIGDVGQNAFEEVDLVRANAAGVLEGGYNFGWPLTEGTHCFPDAVACDWAGIAKPVLDYGHADGDCSVTGGYVYRGERFPSLRGVYLYGDFCSGRIWGLAPNSRQGWTNALLIDTNLALSSFGEDEAGELYVTDLAGGVVYQVTAE